jgi:hypothetical protein
VNRFFSYEEDGSSGQRRRLSDSSLREMFVKILPDGLLLHFRERVQWTPGGHSAFLELNVMVRSVVFRQMASIIFIEDVQEVIVVWR